MEEKEKKTIEADEKEKTDEVKTEEVKTAAELLTAAEQAEKVLSHLLNTTPQKAARAEKAELPPGL